MMFGGVSPDFFININVSVRKVEDGKGESQWRTAVELFTTPHYLYQLVTMSAISALCYMIFYSMSSSM